MTAGTKSHERIQQAMSNVPDLLVDSEFKVTSQDPPIFGYGDVILKWGGEDLLGEIKTMPNEGFEYRKASGKPKVGHLVQLLIYMKILKVELLMPIQPTDPKPLQLVDMLILMRIRLMDQGLKLQKRLAMCETRFQSSTDLVATHQSQILKRDQLPCMAN